MSSPCLDPERNSIEQATEMQQVVLLECNLDVTMSPFSDQKKKRPNFFERFCVLEPV